MRQHFSTSFWPFAFLTALKDVFKKLFINTPGISIGYWNAKKLGIKDEQLGRALNVGFSGGEKKRNEVLQMSLLEPDLAILDETDSGLDIDALKIIFDSE